jgi:hypothetical protein
MEVRLKGRNPRSPGCDDQSVDQKDHGHAHAYLLEAGPPHQSDSIRSGRRFVELYGELDWRQRP